MISRLKASALVVSRSVCLIVTSSMPMYPSAMAAMLSADIVRAKRTICRGVNRPESPSVAIFVFLPIASGELRTKRLQKELNVA